MSKRAPRRHDAILNANAITADREVRESSWRRVWAEQARGIFWALDLSEGHAWQRSSSPLTRMMLDTVIARALEDVVFGSLDGAGDERLRQAKCLDVKFADENGRAKAVDAELGRRAFLIERHQADFCDALLRLQAAIVDGRKDDEIQHEIISVGATLQAAKSVGVLSRRSTRRHPPLRIKKLAAATLAEHVAEIVDRRGRTRRLTGDFAGDVNLAIAEARAAGSDEDATRIARRALERSREGRRRGADAITRADSEIVPGIVDFTDWKLPASPSY